jgi:hypothetical protein
MELYLHSPIRFHGVMLNYLIRGTTLSLILPLFHSSKLKETSCCFAKMAMETMIDNCYINKHVSLSKCLEISTATVIMMW